MGERRGTGPRARSVVDSAIKPVLTCVKFSNCKWREKSRTQDLAAFRRALKGPQQYRRLSLCGMGWTVDSVTYAVFGQ